jgi:hypothetical protein
MTATTIARPAAPSDTVIAAMAALAARLDTIVARRLAAAAAKERETLDS